MPTRPRACIVTLWLLCVLSHSAFAQDVVDRGERLSPERPEAWAMAYLSAATLFLGTGANEGRPPGSFWASLEARHIPRLSRHQRRIGFNGTKLEDLNKSPVFGRLRLGAALPGGFRAEIGWTPPVEIDGARPRHLLAAAIERNLLERDPWRLTMRAFHQRGKVVGDFTCDRATASFDPGTPQNPYGCRAPSRDTFRIDHTGLELSAARRHGSLGLESFASFAYTWMAPSTRVNARTFELIDRSLLTTHVEVPTLSLGGRYSPGGRWQWQAGVSWSPLDVRRQAGADVQSDDLYNLSIVVRRRLP